MPLGFLSQFDASTTVYFDADNVWWAKVRRHLPRRDFKAAQAALISPEMSYVGEDAQTKGRVDTGAYQNELVVRALIDWNLTDSEGNPLPLAPDEARRASVDQLPQDAFEKILTAIEGATKKKPEEVKKETEAFRGDGARGALAPGRSTEDAPDPGSVPAGAGVLVDSGRKS